MLRCADWTDPSGVSTLGVLVAYCRYRDRQTRSWGVETPHEAASVLPSNALSDPAVGEARAYVQGASLKARAALPREAFQLPDHQKGVRTMQDSYPSFFTWVFWILSGGLVMFALVTVTPVGRQLENRVAAFFVFLFFALMAWAVGIMVQGSRSQDNLRDNLRESNRRVLEAQIALEDAEREYNASMAERAGGSASGASSTTQDMDFDHCLRRIREMSQAYGAPINVVETNLVRTVRFPVSDGSVLVTCSRPDRKMILTQSSRR